MHPNSLKNLKRGNPGNAGRKSGRSICLELLDNLVSKTENIKKLNDDFQLEFDKKPSAFYKRYVEPLIPKDQKITLGDQDALNWKISIIKIEPPGDTESSC